MPKRLARLCRLLPLAAALVAAACISQYVEVSSLAPQSGDSLLVTTPVKAHLLDGSTVVFPGGAWVLRDQIAGTGTRYSLVRADSSRVNVVPLDSLLAVETFQTRINTARSIGYTLSGLAIAAVVVPVLAVAIFGSCPTIYADSGGTLALQAESFSSSISPLLESRDIDRLQVTAGEDGRVVLHVMNEALETHYLNHLELLEVTAGRDELVVPDERGRPLALGDIRTPITAQDRFGRDLLPVLAVRDEQAFRSDSALLHDRAGELRDRIELTFAAPVDRDSVALLFRLRSSLLHTVIFYDYMLSRPGARSLDWMARDLGRIDNAVELARWYETHFGLRVQLLDGGEWRQVARFADTGPVAWQDVALTIPVPRGTDSLRLRLSFLADEWRIDHLALAGEVRRVEPRLVPLASVLSRDGVVDGTALAAMRAPDDHYMETRPGERFTAVFDVGAARGDSVRTFLLAAQGYYTEWVRGSWLSGHPGGRAFEPSTPLLRDALATWAAQREDLESRFFTSRVPVP